ncbi:SDR family NAD(P)-dependent oxidoreductase [Nocardioides pacificus]
MAGPRWSADRMPRQDGRHIVITGATGALGLECTRRLAAAGAHVTMAVRSPDKARELSRDMPGNIVIRRLDVSDLADVHEFAGDTGAVDVLINNAGVMGMPLTRTAAGLELQLATNHLGHFLLTSLLLPRLRDRVVAISSAAHRSGHLDVADLNWGQRPYHRYGAYAQSKLCNLFFVAELQRRLTATGSTLRAVAAHPGYSATGIQGQTGSRAFTALAKVGNSLLGMSPAQGALSPLFAATMDVPGNSFIGPHRAREMNGWPTQVGRSRTASDPDLARQVWARSESLTGTECLSTAP